VRPPSKHVERHEYCFASSGRLFRKDNHLRMFVQVPNEKNGRSFVGPVPLTRKEIVKFLAKLTRNLG
jgi:hypothetical protein